MPKEKLDDLEQLANMSVLEVQELIEAMEEKFGVTAAAAVAVAPPHQSVTSAEKSRKQALQNLASSLNARANQLRDKELRSSLLDLMSADSLGLDSDAVPLHRFIPVYV